MTDGEMACTKVWLVVAPKWSRYWPGRVVGARVATLRRTRPETLADGAIAVEVEVRLPLSAFTPTAVAEVKW